MSCDMSDVIYVWNVSAAASEEWYIYPENRCFDKNLLDMKCMVHLGNRFGENTGVDEALLSLK